MSTTRVTWTADEMMSIAAARSLRDGQVCFVGIGLPSTAANLARRLHAPGLVLVYESGTIGTEPEELPLSIGDGILVDAALSVVSVPEIFNYWLQPGRIDVGFLSGAQLDRFANINTTVIGEYAEPSVRLPGSGGAPEIAANCREVVVVMRQRLRSFVERIEQVEEEIKGLTEAKKEIFDEAKGEGYDVKILKEVIRLRKQDRTERDERDSLLDTYLHAIETSGPLLEAAE